MSPRYVHAAFASLLLHGAPLMLALLLVSQVRTPPELGPGIIELVAPGGDRAEVQESGPRIRLTLPPPRMPAVDTPVRPTPPERQPIRDRGRVATTAKPNRPSQARPAAPLRIDEDWSAGPTTPGIAHAPTAQTSTANAEAVEDELKAYFARLQLALRDGLERAGVFPDGLVAIVEVFVAADGRLLRPAIVSSSRHAAFDRAVLALLAQTRLGPRPDGRGSLETIPFRTIGAAER